MAVVLIRDESHPEHFCVHYDISGKIELFKVGETVWYDDNCEVGGGTWTSGWKLVLLEHIKKNGLYLDRGGSGLFPFVDRLVAEGLVIPERDVAHTNEPIEKPKEG